MVVKKLNKYSCTPHFGLFKTFNSYFGGLINDIYTWRICYHICSAAVPAIPGDTRGRTRISDCERYAM